MIAEEQDQSINLSCSVYDIYIKALIFWLIYDNGVLRYMKIWEIDI